MPPAPPLPDLLPQPRLPAPADLARHLATLEERGYCVLPGFLDRSTTAALRALMDRHLPPRTPPAEPGERAPRELRHPIPEAALLARMITPAHLELATQLLQARDLRLLEQVLARTDTSLAPPRARGWHVDRVLFPRHDRARPRQVYHHLVHALSDCAPGGGCFMIVPGSHRLTWQAAARLDGQDLVECQAQGDQLLRDAGVDGSAGIEVPAREGDLIIFNPMCVHSASVNTCEPSRYVLFQSFFDASAVELNQVWEKTWYRHGFPEELKTALPEPLRRLLLR